MDQTAHGAYLRMLDAQRHRRWRARHRDWVRSLQFQIEDLKAMLDHRNQMIEMLRWQLKYENRREQFRSWLIGNFPIEDADEEPKVLY